MDLIRVERELKKRTAYQYVWGRKQNDKWDKQTNFIYTTYSFEKLLYHTNSYNSNLKNYALNRWFNFWSAKAIEHIFCSHNLVKPEKNNYHQTIDFYIDKIPFDHKSTVYPKAYKQTVNKAKENENKLILWLYTHQSREQRMHLKNRLFLVFYNRNSQEHWKLKAEIGLIQLEVVNYLDRFSKHTLHKISVNNSKVVSDIIWIVK